MRRNTLTLLRPTLATLAVMFQSDFFPNRIEQTELDIHNSLAILDFISKR